MAHYAFVDETSVVVDVIAGRDEGEGVDWEQHYAEVRGLRCLRTSYWTRDGVHLRGGVPFRGNYAAIGGRYDEQRDEFNQGCTVPSAQLTG
jgi:hypothetical protein